MGAERPHLLLCVSPRVLEGALEALLAESYDISSQPTLGEHFDVAILSGRRLPAGLSADITVTLPHEGDRASLARIRVGRRSQYRALSGSDELVSLLDELRRRPGDQPV